MVSKETFTNYNLHNSPVLCSFLDANKAFDRLRYCKLLKLLTKRKLPAHIIRLLIIFHTYNFVRVARFIACFIQIRSWMFHRKYLVGALAYADDIVLVASTASALRKLLVIRGDDASEHCSPYIV
jgi:hypothetical protein